MLKKICLNLLVFFLVPIGIQGAWAEDISMDASVVIQAATTATKTDELIYGTLFADPGGDSFTLNVSATATADTTAVVPTATAMASGATTVSVAGSSGRIHLVTSADNIDVTITSPDTVLTPVGASPDTIALIDIGANSSGALIGNTFASAGAYELHIGGELTIPVGVTPDTYTATITVTLTYN